MTARKLSVVIAALIAVAAVSLFIHQYAKIQNMDTRLRSSETSMLVYDQLASSRRYSEAARAKPFTQMMSLFEAITEAPAPSATRNPRIRSDAERIHAVRMGAGFVEVLAGAGQFQDARDLASIITAYDNSPETMSVLRDYAARAGHPKLFFSPAESQ